MGAAKSSKLWLTRPRVRPSEMASWRPRVESKGFRGFSCCTLLLVGLLSAANSRKLSLEQHRSQYLAKPGAIRQTLRRKQDLLIFLNAFLRNGSGDSDFRRCCGIGATFWWSGRSLHSRLGSRTPVPKGGRLVSGSWPVASRPFAVRRRRVSHTATVRWPPSFFFQAASEAPTIHETMEPRMLSSAMVPTTGGGGPVRSHRGNRRRGPCGYDVGPRPCLGQGVMDQGERRYRCEGYRSHPEQLLTDHIRSRIRSRPEARRSSGAGLG